MSRLGSWLLMSFGVLIAMYAGGICVLVFISLVYAAVQGSGFAACAVAFVVVALLIGAWLANR